MPVEVTDVVPPIILLSSLFVICTGAGAAAALRTSGFFVALSADVFFKSERTFVAGAGVAEAEAGGVTADEDFA